MIFLGEEFMQRARSTVDEAVELVLASRGENVDAISEPRGFLVTPQFLDLLSTNVLLNLYNHERASGLNLPAAFKKAATGEAVDLTRQCLQGNDKIHARFIP